MDAKFCEAGDRVESHLKEIKEFMDTIDAMGPTDEQVSLIIYCLEPALRTVKELLSEGLEEQEKKADAWPGDEGSA